VPTTGRRNPVDPLENSIVRGVALREPKGKEMIPPKQENQELAQTKQINVAVSVLGQEGKRLVGSQKKRPLVGNL